MRSLNAAALAKIAQRYGNEAIIILDIAWTPSSVIQYADRDIESVKGKILEVSNLDAVVNINSSADSQELNIVLDDTDDTIKTIMDNHDIHKRDVWVYQWFEGLALTDRFLLFKGKINSPIIWNEGDRTVSFSILAQIEDKEIGFSPEEGEIENIDQALVGKPWPMVFGTVTHSKTIRLTNRVQGITTTGVGWADTYLGARASALSYIGQYMRYDWGGPSNQYYTQYVDATATYLEQKTTERSNITIIGGENFPRGNISIEVGNTILNGYFSGNVFHISSCKGGYDHPNKYDFFAAHKVAPRAITVRIETWYGGVSQIPTGEITGENLGYVYCQPGSTVKLYSVEPQRYVVSITPGEVLRVVAWSQKDGQRFIQDVPENWYTVTTETFGIFDVTILTLNDAIGKKEEMGFEDDLYVTFKSTIGPNTVDILEYLITTYSDFTTDAVSFANVKTRLTNYPSHFTIYDQKNIVQVLQEIAWQACCAIYLKNSKFYLLYLPEEQTSVDTLYKKDILTNTFELQHTTTEDLVTKMRCEWTASGIQEDPFKTILRHNVTKYGIQEETYDYYIYDFVDAVVKSATFWLIRYSNTWKKAHFQLPLTKLNLETFDTITLDSDNIIANSSFLAFIEEAGYNSENNTIDITCWCPIKAGSMVTYDFAYPADVATWKTFPTDYEIQEEYQGGAGPGKTVKKTNLGESPSGNLSVSLMWPEENEYEQSDPYNEKSKDTDDRRNNDQGNVTPSNTDDVHPGEKIQNPYGTTIEENAPGPESPNSDGYITRDKELEAKEREAGGETWNDKTNEWEGGSGDPSSSERQDALDELPDADKAEYGTCPKLVVSWVRGIKSTFPSEGKAGCGCDGTSGSVCTATSADLETIIFNSNAEVEAYEASLEAAGDFAMGACGEDTIWDTRFYPGTDDCNDTGVYDGPIAYNNVDSPNGYGSGAWLDGSDSSEWYD